jgi:hypothetical protein
MARIPIFGLTDGFTPMVKKPLGPLDLRTLMWIEFETSLTLLVRIGKDI